MLKKLIIAHILFFNCIQLLPQSGFSLLISTLKEEIIFDAAEDENGDFYLAGYKFQQDPYEQNAYFLALNSFGDILFEMEFDLPDTITYFGSIHYANDSIFIFGAKGDIQSALMNYFWILVLDSEFNIITNNSIELDGYNITDFESIVKTNHNFLINGNGKIQNQDTDNIFIEISRSGTLVHKVIHEFDGSQFTYDLVEIPPGNYRVFAYGGFPGSPPSLGSMAMFDSTYNYISADSIPNQLYFNHSAKRLDDSTLLITGNKHFYNPLHSDLAIIKVTLDNELISNNHFGKIYDTTSYVGAISNLDISSSNSIYFGGASNIFPSHLMYQPEDSWLILNNIDSDLNLNWQRFYGGDACYYLWGLKATQDGGCLMLATRYDEMTQFEELDVFILKVDSNGLLTSTGDQPNIPANELNFYPNPARENITIKYPDIFAYQERELVIYNALGYEVRKVVRAPGQPEVPIDVSAFAPGLYIAVLYVNGEKIAVGKFVVM